MKRILTVAGSDSGGGAGIQADLKTIAVLGGYGMSAITALTAQNTVGVQGVHPVPVDFIAMQMESVLSDIGADAAKTGMLATPEIVDIVVSLIAKYDIRPLVVDPVMVAKSGDSLLDADARQMIRTALLPLATAVTPNLQEAEILSGRSLRNLDEMKGAARRIHDLGPNFVVVKGGHLEGRAVDLLFDGETFQNFDVPRLNQRNTHGTGCTFSAALALFLAENAPISEAVEKAKRFIARTIAAGLNIGAGHGPTNPYAEILQLREHEAAPDELTRSVALLAEHKIGGLIPEVRSNFGYALTGAEDYRDIAAFPGRISQIGEDIVVYKSPVFGASRHIARVILAAMKHHPHLKSALNIRYHPTVLDACKKIGLQSAFFARSREPGEIKAREGSTLEWGTDDALKRCNGVPDLVFDEGETGKEPMIRVLGENPMNVAKKVIRIKQNISDPT